MGGLSGCRAMASQIWRGPENCGAREAGRRGGREGGDWAV